MMDYADLEVLSHLTDWVEAGKKSWLCTVVKTWGSSPRPVGSLLCCSADGEVVGSLSGGCIEEDLLERLHQGKLASVKPELLIYGATQEEVERFQLPCGGQLHVVIEPMLDNSNLVALLQMTERLKSRECIERILDVGSGKFEVKAVDRFRHLEFDGEFEDFETTGKTLTQTYGPRFQLFLIGAGNVSLYLA